MDAAERHKRVREIDAEIRRALELRAKYQEDVDSLHAERERLETECFDEFCPCVEDEEDDDGNNRCTSGEEM